MSFLKEKNMELLKNTMINLFEDFLHLIMLPMLIMALLVLPFEYIYYSFIRKDEKWIRQLNRRLKDSPAILVLFLFSPLSAIIAGSIAIYFCYIK